MYRLFGKVLVYSIYQAIIKVTFFAMKSKVFSYIYSQFGKALVNIIDKKLQEVRTIKKSNTKM